MDTSPLLQSLRQHIQLTSEEEEELLRYFRPKVYKRKELLLEEGQIAQEVAFVLSGCLRSYSIDEKGLEHNIQFAPSGWWITDMYSFISKKTSLLFTDAIEESEVLLLSRQKQLELFDAIPKTERYFRILTENALCSTRQRVIDNLSLTAKERYLHFCNVYPTLIHHVAQKHIASYIGVTPEFLSKMRNQLLRE